MTPTTFSALPIGATFTTQPDGTIYRTKRSTFTAYQNGQPRLWHYYGLQERVYMSRVVSLEDLPDVKPGMLVRIIDPIQLRKLREDYNLTPRQEIGKVVRFHNGFLSYPVEVKFSPQCTWVFTRRELAIVLGGKTN